MASQPEPYEHMSLEAKNKADLKIKQFEESIIDLARQVNSDNVDKEYTADEAIIESDSGNVKLFYFIGRLNPPHNGHIAALNKLVQMANSQGSIPLIILGSGPGSDDETKRTMDNPISFETKERFIRNVLPGRYKIVKMSNAALDVSHYVEDGLQDIGNVKNITINHIAGGKDEDATKLSFALKAAKNTASTIAPDALIDASVVSIEPETTDSGSAMSATKVRKDAYKTILNGTGFEGWPEEYKQFYGAMAPEVYNQILYPLQKIPESEKEHAIIEYISSGSLPSIKKGTKRKKGGSKRVKKGKTQKRNKKHIKKRRITKRK